MNARLYYVDGYHGGVEGHMPAGALEDIMAAMERHQEWKLSFEIEPESWNYIKTEDPVLYDRICAFVAEETAKGRLEFICGAYGQPFCWAINGESNIRQLTRGITEIKKHFPEVVIDTYAVQEPCFTSMLPQIVTKLGFKRMVLKNPTAWGGYMDKMPGEITDVYSADGSTVPTVPRYECEETVLCSETEGAGYDFPAVFGFADKCVENGIPHPVGMCLQDLGWKSAPHLSGMNTEYVTFREYFERFGAEKTGSVKFSQDDILCALPWGNLTFQRMCRNVRAVENRILQIEKFAAAAAADGMDTRHSEELLKEAWDDLLLVQHHDGYICATTKGSPYGSWARRADYLTIHADKLLDGVRAELFEQIREKEAGASAASDCRWARVYNTSGVSGTQMATVTLAFPPGYRDFSVTSSCGAPLLSQVRVLRTHKDGTIAAAKVHFAIDMTGLAYKTVCIRGLADKKYEEPILNFLMDHNAYLSTAYVTAVFDLYQGGGLVRLRDVKSGKELVQSGQVLGTFTGFFPDAGGFHSTKDVHVTMDIVENGPLCCEIVFKGELEGNPFETTVCADSLSGKIVYRNKFTFPKEVRIGAGEVPETPELRFYGVKRAANKEEYKLGVDVPLAEGTKIYKSAPFETYESKVTDTRFDGWDTIKNDMINGYVDLYRAEEDCGLAVFCDHLTGYSMVGNSFKLTQAVGCHAGFWWGNEPLKGESTIGYAFMVHDSDWERGAVDREAAIIAESLMVVPLAAEPVNKERTFFMTEDKALRLVTVRHDDDGPMMRLYRASKEAGPLSMEVNLKDPDCDACHGLLGEECDLWGNPIGNSVFGKMLAPFEIVTIR